ncbi:response regulator receiver modulated GAF sensor protein [Halorubrum aidingense JCM 13560]|uniref:Response regulator receiver modulated GAF sensor protein n=1 Tax=Halorubrum aidingense JCM 13560 TaxID=1230454 RepID=M0PM64_9EURY|nr:bacterio-opsin activator domain-containing protein [Halorubrum aidingense]EMA70744.1 response regulator receiver modulated GAF sensor protein [Halorubrum aidingense JCM 13560]
MSDDTLDVLLIEDDPGDARLVKKMLDNAETDLRRIDLDGSSPTQSAVHHESTLTAGVDRLSERAVDVILLDLELPDSTVFDTLVSVVDAAELTPVVVLTGPDDRDLGIQTIQHGARDYLVKDEVTGGLLVHSIQYAIEQSRQERERIRQRERLEAFNRLYRINQDVIHALITESTREDLERAVCERLVEPDAYDFAWMGDLDHSADRFSRRESAPADCGFDVAAIPSDGETDGERPEAEAVRTREVQVVEDIETAPGFDQCREQMRTCGYRTMVAIPVAYGNICYGVLAVYDESPNAFVHTDRENLSRLGAIIGHAITAVERKDALTSDTMLQLTFSRDGETDDLVTASADGWTLEFEHLIQTDPGILAYGSAEGGSKKELAEVVGRSTLVKDLRILSPEAETYEVELTMNWGETLIPALAKHGFLVTEVTIADGEFQFVVEVPPGRDKHRLVELVQDHYADATLRAQWTVSRDEPAIADFHSAFENQLTEKQRAVLKTAFHAGYFDWPRKSTGEEVADLLGVTQATFSEHFRGAERTLFEAVFETTAGDGTVPASPWDPSNSNGDQG